MTSFLFFDIFRSSWRISKSYSRCCSSSSSCGLFCFTAYSFHRNFLKLGIESVKIPCADSNNLRFGKFLLEKKIYDVKISLLMEIASKIISETRQAFWILFAGIEQGISRDELPHIWYITMTSYQFLWRHSYFLFHNPEFSSDLRETCHVYAESPRAGSNHLRFWKFLIEKKSYDVKISPLMEIG